MYKTYEEKTEKKFIESFECKFTCRLVIYFRNFVCLLAIELVDTNKTNLLTKPDT